MGHLLFSVGQINYRLGAQHQLAPRACEGGCPEGAGGAEYDLPQSKIGFAKPIFASPLINAGAKAAAPINDNLPYQLIFSNLSITFWKYSGMGAKTITGLPSLGWRKQRVPAWRHWLS